MKVTISYNDELDGIELRFSDKPAAEILQALKNRMGFRYSRSQHLWWAKKTPQRILFAEELKKTLEDEDGPSKVSIPIQPSFEPSEENIKKRKFSYVTLYFKDKEGKTGTDNFIVFEPTKPLALDIATHFGQNLYRNRFEKAIVYPKKYIREARNLLNTSKLIGDSVPFYDGGGGIANKNNSETIEEKPPEQSKERVNINKEGLRPLRPIEVFIEEKDKEGTPYSEEDKEFIKSYTGSGGLASKGATGKGLLYEYYTHNELVKKMWGLAYANGYNGGQVLEPSCGTGNFLPYVPAGTKVVGFEVNPTAARIASILYPHATIHNHPFETLFFTGNIHLKDEFGGPRFDLVIGNPPYGTFSGKYAGMGEKKWTGATEYDQYFLTRGLDLLLSGGLLVFLIPSSFLQNENQYNTIKEKINQKAALKDAYRLPEGMFKTTSIGTDIVVFQVPPEVSPTPGNN